MILDFIQLSQSVKFKIPNITVNGLIFTEKWKFLEGKALIVSITEANEILLHEKLEGQLNESTKEGTQLKWKMTTKTEHLYITAPRFFKSCKYSSTMQIHIWKYILPPKLCTIQHQYILFSQIFKENYKEGLSYF